MEDMLYKKNLMIPGPTKVSRNVLKEMSREIRPHYGEEWVKDFKNIIKKLKKIFKTKNQILVFPGTGSLAIESAISSSINFGDEVLICHNGFWGERFIEICKSWKIKSTVLRKKFNQPIKANDIEEQLRKNKNIKAVLLVHVETSTGLSNPLQEIAKVVKKYNALFIVDSIAGLGGVKIETDLWNIDFLITSSQKCLGAPAGLGFLSISKSAEKKIISKSKRNNIGWSTNIKNIYDYKEKWKGWHPHGPTTAPVSLYLALEKSLENIFTEKLINVYARHIKIRNFVRKSIRNLGLQLFIESDEYAAETLTTFLLPKKINPKVFMNNIKKKHSIILSGDLGYVHKQLIRVGHMGNHARMSLAKKTIEAISKELKGN